MVSYEKLVRDRIPEILDQKGVPHVSYVASPERFRKELIRKLNEEANEFAEASSVEELADVLEGIDAFQRPP